jgi:hypothetical protein
VEGVVQGAVTTSVEPGPHGAATAGGQGAGAGEGGERCVVAASTGVGERHDGLGGADRADATTFDQSGGDVVDDGLQLGAVGLELAGCRGQGERGAADLGVSYGPLAAGLAWWPAPGQAGQAGLGARRGKADDRCRPRSATAIGRMDMGTLRTACSAT